MGISEDINKREKIAGYIKEAVANLKQQDLLKSRLKDIKDSVKDSDLIDPKEFNSAILAAYDLDKHQEKIDSLQAGVDIVDTLGL